MNYYKRYLTEDQLRLFCELQKLYSIREEAPKVLELKNGVKLLKIELSKIAKLLRNFKSIREKQDNFVAYNVEKDGENVGFIQINEDSPEVINISWLYIKPKYEDNHLGTEVMKGIIEGLKKFNYKKATLEVPNTFSKAVHIYRKLGFKETKRNQGLIYMEKAFL